MTSSTLSPDMAYHKRHQSKKSGQYHPFGKSTSLQGHNSHQKRLNQENIKQEEIEYMKRDFNPINSLKKNSSTQKLIEKHHESLNKIH